jgi:hypothetical protein
MTSPHHSKPTRLSRRAIAATAAAALVTLAAAAAGPTWAAAANERCAGAVERHLRGLGLEVGAVEQTSLITEYASLEMGTTRGIQAWTSLKDCSGSLVTQLTTSCRIKDTYTRGDCQVAGVTHRR